MGVTTSVHNSQSVRITDLTLNRLGMLPLMCQQSGAVEACWAHNPKVSGSKPRSAKLDLKLNLESVNQCSIR